MSDRDSTLERLLSQLGDDSGRAEFEELVSFARDRSKLLGPPQIAELALRLAGKPVESSIEFADIASTGGPGSLSTILPPLFLASQSVPVLKVGVPGRPAGGVDSLAQIPDYEVAIPVDRAIRLFAEGCHYLHVLAGDDFAPLDAALFRFRKETDSIQMPMLAIASILAKKVAAKVKLVGLDQRVWEHGNLGTRPEEARGYARVFCETASLLNMRAVVFLTDGRVPRQPFIGRGEAILALQEILNGTASEWLKKHVEECRVMVEQTLSLVGKAVPQSGWSTADVVSEHVRNLEFQGSTLEKQRGYVMKIASEHKHAIRAEADGNVTVDLQGVREALVAGQRQVSSDAVFSDPCGVIVRKPPGETVKRGEVLATVRIAPALEGSRTLASVATCFGVGHEERRDWEMEVIGLA